MRQQRSSRILPFGQITICRIERSEMDLQYYFPSRGNWIGNIAQAQAFDPVQCIQKPGVHGGSSVSSGSLAGNSSRWQSLNKKAQGPFHGETGLGRRKY
jgi:hypothetical protein